MDSSVARSATRLDVLYDDEADVLYVSLGAPRPADTFPGEHGLLVRKDMNTGEVVGVTIMDYERHFRKLKDLSWLAESGLPSDLAIYLQLRPSERAA
ncbi:MAG: DUF2283 domain-containing protein [Candidatus Binatales bacterium]